MGSKLMNTIGIRNLSKSKITFPLDIYTQLVTIFAFMLTFHHWTKNMKMLIHINISLGAAT
jgi:hypothetical protein